MDREYRIFGATFSKNDAIKDKQNAINFLNRGTSTVTINNLELSPGEQLSISGQTDEVDVTEYQITFITGAALSNKLIVLRKVFVK